jgi:hypothetical protein
MRVTRRNVRSSTMALAAAVALVATAADAGAQETTRRPARRQQPIEIRGQVPTPQVVTVRPREVPQYNRRFLVPDFYDHDFWPAILPGYQIVSRRLVTGNGRLDSLLATGADSGRMADSARMAASGRAAIGIGLLTRPQPRPMAGDTTRRTLTPADTTPRRQMMTTPPTPADTTRRPPVDAQPAAPRDTPRQAGGTPPASAGR